jgi:uncharacterized pyridoxal phosphate-containing UPF0001 family protein
MPVLVEINVAAEPNKSGALPEEAEDFIKEISALPGLRVKGLMTMAPKGCTEEQYREYFGTVKRMFDSFRETLTCADMEILSMGMSDTYALACECGSNMVRVGSAVFGKRIYPEEQNENK